ncbi:MAG: DUF4430 domain-containing protein [Candidatus Aenigmarchaeota archaeon]|nr:DUF4430 domain-containing protein [Candidatus Aenigmarchaeota archaeon]
MKFVLDFDMAEEMELEYLEDDYEEPKGKSARSRYDEDEEKDKESYRARFHQDLSGVHFDENDKTMKIEYDLLYEEMDPLVEKSEYIHELENLEKINVTDDIMLLRNEFEENTTVTEPYPAEMLDDVMSIEYEAPTFINGQKTYQRIVFEADVDGESVYELTQRKFGKAGIDASSEYDSEFKSVLFTSIDGHSEGDGGNFNEFYLNGEIGENAVDLQSVKKGDIIEWRYAEETDGSCGGVPDFYSIQNALQYSLTAQAQAQTLGIQKRAYGL